MIGRTDYTQSRTFASVMLSHFIDSVGHVVALWSRSAGQGAGGQGDLSVRNGWKAAIAPKSGMQHPQKVVPTNFQLARGVLVTFAAAVLGALLGGLVLFRAPLEGLPFAPFTFAGAGLALLPAYLWAHRSKGWSRTLSYIVVLIAGIVGSSVLLMLFLLLLGGITAGAPPLDLLGAAAAFGAGTATAWIPLHHVTRSSVGPDPQPELIAPPQIPPLTQIGLAAIGRLACGAFAFLERAKSLNIVVAIAKAGGPIRPPGFLRILRGSKVT